MTSLIPTQGADTQRHHPSHHHAGHRVDPRSVAPPPVSCHQCFRPMAQRVSVLEVTGQLPDRWEWSEEPDHPEHLHHAPP